MVVLFGMYHIYMYVGVTILYGSSMNDGVPSLSKANLPNHYFTLVFVFSINPKLDLDILCSGWDISVFVVFGDSICS